MEAVGRPPDLSPIVRRAALFALFSAIGLLFFSYRRLDDLARGIFGTAEVRFIEEMTAAYAALIIVPIVTAATRRLPWGATPWPRFVLGHALAALLFSTAHTTLMALSRSAIFALAGLGHYDYGAMTYRYPMEFSNDVMVYAVAAGFIYVWRQMRRQQRLALDAARLRQQLAQTQLENLRLQLQPHFLFNALNAISSVMYEDPRAADTMITRLSEFLRLTLAAADRPETTVENELRMTASYIDVMRARFEHGLRLEQRWEPGTERALVPSMLLQPLVENAIVHAVRRDGRALEVAVDVRRERDDLLLVVRDNGDGLKQDAAPSEGHGLGKTRSRLAQRYGERHQLQLEGDAGGGACVRVRIPLRTAPLPP